MGYQLEILHENRKIQNPKGCIVFVHGICHGAWCWENFIAFFSNQGYLCYAVSLRGHGNSDGRREIGSFCLADYVADVKSVVEQCPRPNWEKPFLIGHSMGGAVVQSYIGAHADTVAGAVLFAPATAPHMFFPQTLWSSFTNFHLLFATLIANFGWRAKCIVHHAAFFTGKDERGKRIQRVQDTERYRKILQRESPQVIYCGLHTSYAHNYNVDVPILVLGSHADLYFPDKSLMKTADVYKHNQKTALVFLDCLCHDMMLDKDWEKSALPVLSFVENPTDFVKAPENRWPRDL